MTDRETKIVWAAGFLDGEGCFTASRCTHKGNNTEHTQVLIDAAQNVMAPIVVLHDLFGGTVRNTRNKYGEYFVWRAHGKTAGRVCAEVLPYLLVKAEQARLIIRFVETIGQRGPGQVSVETRTLRESILVAIRAMNHRQPQAERLSEEAPGGNQDGAIVRSHGNNNRETGAEMTPALKIVG